MKNQTVGTLRRRAKGVAVAGLAVIAGGLAAYVPAVFASSPAATVQVVPLKPNKVIMIDIARAGKRLVAVGERGVVFNSDDDGATWTSLRTETTRTLTSVAFADDKTGVIAGHGGALFRTEDGGATWNVVKIDALGSDSLLNVAAMGGQVFAAVGSFGKFFVSIDGGRNWAQKTAVDADFDRHIFALIPAGDYWFLAGETGNISRTRDQGQTWDKLPSPYNGSFFGAVRAKDGALLAYGMRGNIWYSGDDGTSWRQVKTNTTIGFNGARLMEDGTLVFVGNTGVVAVSRDNGKTVKMQRSPKGTGFGSVAQNTKGELVYASDSGVGILDRALWAE